MVPGLLLLIDSTKPLTTTSQAPSQPLLTAQPPASDFLTVSRHMLAAFPLHTVTIWNTWPARPCVSSLSTLSVEALFPIPSLQSRKEMEVLHPIVQTEQRKAHVLDHAQAWVMGKLRETRTRVSRPQAGDESPLTQTSFILRLWCSFGTC